MGKFFTEKVHKKNKKLNFKKIKFKKFDFKKFNIKKILIIGGSLVGIILLAVLIKIFSVVLKKPVLKLYNEYSVEVNTVVPEKKQLFKKIRNFDENDITVDYKDLDISKIGSYVIDVNAKNHGNKNVKINVVDTTAPILSLKELSIIKGTIYTIDQFVESCSDNSLETCQYKYAVLKDSKGIELDQNAFSEVGLYDIKITAFDSSGNENTLKTKLTIQNNETEVPVTPPEEPQKVNCEYGNLDYDTQRYLYPIALIVGDEANGCAVNKDLWNDDTYTNEVYNFYKSDYEILKKELAPYLLNNFPNGSKIVAKPDFKVILNKDETGFVGYGIYVLIYAASASENGNIDIDENLILEYYLTSSKTRQYIKNDIIK